MVELNFYKQGSQELKNYIEGHKLYENSDQ